MLDTLQILCLIGIFYAGYKLGRFLEDLRDSVVELDMRLTKLEKDAVKITFNDPYSPQDEESVKKIKPLTEGRVKSQIKEYEGEMPMTQAPPPPKPPKRLGEWQTKNGSPKYKRKPKTE